jgi:hypothetical protein
MIARAEGPVPNRYAFKGRPWTDEVIQIGPSKKTWGVIVGEIGDDTAVIVPVGVSGVSEVSSGVGENSMAGVEVGCIGVGPGTIVKVTLGEIGVDVF